MVFFVSYSLLMTCLDYLDYLLPMWILSMLLCYHDGIKLREITNIVLWHLKSCMSLSYWMVVRLGACLCFFKKIMLPNAGNVQNQSKIHAALQCLPNCRYLFFGVPWQNDPCCLQFCISTGPQLHRASISSQCKSQF